MTDNNDAKLVAEIEVDSPIAFSTSMDDIVSAEDTEDPNEEVQEGVEIPVEPASADAEEKVEEQDENDEQDDEESSFDDYSEAALTLEALKRKNPLFSDIELEKDGEWGDFVEKLDDKINTLTKEKEEAILAMYKDMGLPDEEAKDLLETAKLNDKLDTKVSQAIKRFAKKEKEILENEKQRRELREKQQREQTQAIIDNMNSIIDNGEILGMDLSKKEREDLKDAFFKPSEVVEVPDGRGGTVLKRLTKYQVLEMEFKNSLEQQIAFGKLLIDGFKLDKIKEQTKKERDDEIINVLNGRKSSKRKRRSSTRNAYLAP